MAYTYKYPRPAVTADCVVMTKESEPKVLLIQRGNEPFKGCWALPGGFMEMDETLEECARRELKEETGWEAEDWQPLTTMCGSVGYTNEKIEIWKARCTIKGETNFDYGEDVDLYEFTLPEVLAMVDRGEIYDAKTVIAVLMLAREAGLK
mgnify:CR=1 FL=1